MKFMSVFIKNALNEKIGNRKITKFFFLSFENNFNEAFLSVWAKLCPKIILFGVFWGPKKYALRTFMNFTEIKIGERESAHTLYKYNGERGEYIGVVNAQIKLSHCFSYSELYTEIQFSLS